MMEGGRLDWREYQIKAPPRSTAPQLLRNVDMIGSTKRFVCLDCFNSMRNIGRWLEAFRGYRGYRRTTVPARSNGIRLWSQSLNYAPSTIQVYPGLRIFRAWKLLHVFREQIVRTLGGRMPERPPIGGRRHDWVIALSKTRGGPKIRKYSRSSVGRMRQFLVDSRQHGCALKKLRLRGNGRTRREVLRRRLAKTAKAQGI